MYEIIKDIEIPKELRVRRCKYPFLNLKIGEGFKINPDADTSHRMHGSVYYLKLAGKLPKEYKIMVRGEYVKRIS